MSAFKRCWHFKHSQATQCWMEIKCAMSNSFVVVKCDYRIEHDSPGTWLDSFLSIALQIPFCRHNSLLSFSLMQKHNKFFQLVCDNLCFVCSPLHFPSCALIAITTFNIHNKIATSLLLSFFLIHKNIHFLSLHLYYSLFWLMK